MTSIGIIGSGFGGLSVAAEMLRHGHTDVRLWERADSSGGVWRDNTYPGAGCDAPSPIYSFSWAQDVRWSRRYALQGEILDYLRDLSDAYGVTERTTFGRGVAAAAWTGEQWEVTFEDGATERVDVLVPAVGQLSRPVLPPIPGVDTFTGASFHSARWDHDADLTGRVAVVGTGASAIQFVPHLAERAEHVTVFQRTPNWIVPKPDMAFRRWYAPLIRTERPWQHRVAETFSLALDEDTRTARVLTRLARTQLRVQVKDPELRRVLTPDYPIGCKRILFSNNWYPTLMREDVSLLTHAVERITPTGLVAGGEEHAYDAIVYGTGFDAQDFLDSIAITGRGGRTLRDQWAGGARAYLGIYVPGFPNFFISYGPNTNLGGGSITFMLEAQARHMRQVLERMEAAGASTVEVTEPAEQRWDTALQHRLERSAWASCHNWYTDPRSGRITSNWPGATDPYARATRVVDEEAFAWR